MDPVGSQIQIGGNVFWSQLRVPSPSNSCLKDFEQIFPSDSSRDYDMLFHSRGTDISLYSVLEQIVFNQQKIDDIWSHLVLNLLDRQLPSDISMTIVKYLN